MILNVLLCVLSRLMQVLLHQGEGDFKRVSGCHQHLCKHPLIALDPGRLDRFFP